MPGYNKNFELTVEDMELIEDALRAAEGNRTRAARQLGIAKSSLYEKLNRHGLLSETP